MIHIYFYVQLSSGIKLFVCFRVVQIAESQLVGLDDDKDLRSGILLDVLGRFTSTVESEYIATGAQNTT